MVTAKYPFSQGVSSETMRVLWNNCRNNIGPMQELKAIYTDELCDERIASINAADALPDEAARAMVHETIRTELVTSSKDCTRKWKYLKLYINGVYEGEEARTIQYNGAGWAHYEGAAAQNWQDVNDLMQSGSNYITANTDALKGAGGDNMPDTFPAAFDLAWETFKTKRKAFTDALNDSQAATAQKVDDINNCYDAAILMGTDGQTVFQADPEKARLFSFEAMGAVVAPAGPASFEVLVTVNGVAKPGAEVSIENSDRSEVTGADGKTVFTQMSGGALTCNIICDGFISQQVTETLDAGVRRRITVELQPLFDGAMKVGSEKSQESGVRSSETQQAVGN